jgi:hypothetical protein
MTPATPTHDQAAPDRAQLVGSLVELLAIGISLNQRIVLLNRELEELHRSSLPADDPRTDLDRREADHPHAISPVEADGGQRP